MSLEPIFQYGMNPEEIKAYKLCLLWEKIMDKELPDYHKYRIGRGDPRKSLIFKYCYKLARETQDFIPDEEYKLYIYSQIHTLKNISDGKIHALIEPACLVGDKAWRRWVIWKKKYDKVYKTVSNKGDTTKITATETEVRTELAHTKKFFTTQFGENYKKEALNQAFQNSDFVKWIAFNKISPYYLILSPAVREHFENLEENLSVEVELYERSVTPEIRVWFSTVFKEEF